MIQNECYNTMTIIYMPKIMVCWDLSLAFCQVSFRLWHRWKVGHLSQKLADGFVRNSQIHPNPLVNHHVSNDLLAIWREVYHIPFSDKPE